MFSVVLATVMTASTAAPSWGKCYGCKGCWGCHGCWGCACSCSCYGCWGCSGCGCWGCHGCWGCSSCGGCWYGCSCSCWGWGCWGCYSGVPVAVPAVVTPPAKAAVAPTPSPTQAIVIVQLPSEAQLYVDGKLSNQSASPRMLVTPQLEAGKDYFYTLKVELTRDGKTLSESREVIVKAGQTSRVDFTNVGQGQVAEAEGSPAKVTVRLPAEAKLYVDGMLAPMSSPTRTFNTPRLAAGQKYFYTLKAELDQDGQKRTETRQVVVEAGKQVEVDFQGMASLVTAQR